MENEKSRPPHSPTRKERHSRSGGRGSGRYGESREDCLDRRPPSGTTPRRAAKKMDSSFEKKSRISPRVINTRKIDGKTIMSPLAASVPGGREPHPQSTEKTRLSPRVAGIREFDGETMAVAVSPAVSKIRQPRHNYKDSASKTLKPGAVGDHRARVGGDGEPGVVGAHHVGGDENVENSSPTKSVGRRSSRRSSPKKGKNQRPASTVATPTSSRSDSSGKKGAGPKIFDDETGDTEEQTEATPSSDMIRTGAYFITETGSVVERRRGRLTNQPDPDEAPTASSRGLESAENAEVQMTADVSFSHRENPTLAEKEETPWFCTKKFKIVAVILVVAAIAIGVVVPLATGGGGDGESATSAPQSRNVAVRAALIASGATALDEEGSPQNLAMNWLISMDTLSPIENNVDDESIEKLLRRYALVVFYYGTGGETWLMKEDWLDGEVEECNWEQIGCEDGDIVSIDTGASGGNVAGSIPTEISALTSLRKLMWRNNKISGLPPEMGLLTNMTTLILELNTLEGNIPSFVYDLSLLETLHLNQNSLNGTISTRISTLTNLKELWLSANSLTGTLTSELQSLAALTHLDLSYNMLNGNIDQVTSGLILLEGMRLDKNKFGGSLPTEIGTFLQMQDLNVAQNELVTSTIPTEVGKLTHLLILSLFKTGISGTIPSELGNLVNLTGLYLENTLLTGSIPDELCTIFDEKNGTLAKSLDCVIQCNCSVCDDECV